MGKHIIRTVIMVLAVILVVIFMIHFRFTHSAKERLREAGIRNYRMGRYEEAADFFSLALKQKEAFTSQTDQDIYLYLADGEMKREKYTSAVTYYEKLLEQKVDSVELYANLGMCYECMGKYDAAYEYLKKAIKKKNDDSELYYTICEVCLHLDMNDEAAEYAKEGYSWLKKQMSKDVKQIVKAGKADGISAMQLRELTKCGQLAYLSGDYDSAYNYYSILYQSGEQSAGLYMGHCLSEKGDYENALTLLKQYEAANGAHPLSLAKQVYCYIHMEKYEEALKLADTALNAEGQQLTEELLYEKGIALEHTGDFDGAFDCFDRYLQMNPEDEEAKREYDFLITRISNEKAAQAGVDNGNQ